MCIYRTVTNNECITEAIPSWTKGIVDFILIGVTSAFQKLAETRVVAQANIGFVICHGNVRDVREKVFLVLSCIAPPVIRGVEPSDITRVGIFEHRRIAATLRVHVVHEKLVLVVFLGTVNARYKVVALFRRERVIYIIAFKE